MLSNVVFISKAPKEKIELEKTKLKEYIDKLNEIEKLLIEF